MGDRVLNITSSRLGVLIALTTSLLDGCGSSRGRPAGTGGSPTGTTGSSPVTDGSVLATGGEFAAGGRGGAGDANMTDGVTGTAGTLASGGVASTGGTSGGGGGIGAGGAGGSGGIAGSTAIMGSGGVTSTDGPLGGGGVVDAGGVGGTGATMDGGGTTVSGLAVLAGVPYGLGSADGTGPAARFFAPYGLAVDGAGNVFVADTDNYTIRKITPAGVVTTFAGTAGSLGSADGTGAAARFTQPFGVAVDGEGNLLVADTYNSTIRKITPAGGVTTFAGVARATGSTDGTGTAARFSGPKGLEVDGAGNVFVADTENHTIRKITPTGVVTTLAGKARSSGSADGTGAAALFNSPQGVAVDGAGNVFVADTGNHTIRKISPTGVVTTVAGSAGLPANIDATGTAARFNTPSGLAVDGAGNVLVADAYNHTVRKITPDGVVTTLTGTAGSSGGAGATGNAARFLRPSDVALDGAGNVFVADTEDHTIWKITPAGDVTTLAGTAGSIGNADGTGAAARFAGASAVTLDSAGNLLVADSSNNIIRKITRAGVVTTLAAPVVLDGGTDSPNFFAPQGVAVDREGNVVVADTVNQMIRKITPAGLVATIAGAAVSSGTADGTGTAARFSWPIGVAVDGEDTLVVTDSNNCTIRKITPAGVVTTFAGTAGSDGSADGTGAAARFNKPAGVAVDGAGNVFVADRDNHTIRKITPAGVVTTLAGTAGSAGSADGTGAAARFSRPTSVAVDGAGNVFVADTDNNAVRKITAFGVVSTVVGVASPTRVGTFPGPLPASINNPMGVAVDASNGNLYITLDSAVMVAVFK